MRIVKYTLAINIPFMTFKAPHIIGHRGCAGYAPENTLEAIHTAADMGVSWIECDVKLTKDDIPITFHDDTLDRTTNGTGAVRDKTLAEIKELDAGSWFSDGFGQCTVPALEEVMDVVLERGLGMNLEIKPCEGREKETAEIALDVLASAWDDMNTILISSFAHTCLEISYDMAPDFPRGFLLPEDWPENWRQMIDALNPATININGNTVTQEQVELLLPLGKPLLAYTIDDPHRAHVLKDWGVHGFFTDVPDVIEDIF